MHRSACLGANELNNLTIFGLLVHANLSPIISIICFSTVPLTLCDLMSPYGDIINHSSLPDVANIACVHCAVNGRHVQVGTAGTVPLKLQSLDV